MRRIVIVGIVAAFVLGIAATAMAKGHDNGKSYLVRQPGARAVTAEHIDALNACDIDRLMAQYPPSIHIILPDGGQAVGRAEVLALFEGFCSDPADGGLNGLQFTEIESWKVAGTINMQWNRFWILMFSASSSNLSAGKKTIQPQKNCIC